MHQNIIKVKIRINLILVIHENYLICEVFR